MFKLKAPPEPLRCYAMTRQLQLELGLSYGLTLMAKGWKVPMQPRSIDTIRMIQEAMITYCVKVGSMPENFTVQAWVTVSMELEPNLKRHENRAKFTKLIAEAGLPFKSIKRTGKPKIRHGALHFSFWSKGFPARVEDRIYFLDGYKVLEIENLDLSYPETFPALKSPLFYQFGELKPGAHRG